MSSPIVTLISGTAKTELKLANAQSAGGKTGSVRVALDGDNYQYKPPVAQNSLKRQAKSLYGFGTTDSENLGEKLATELLKTFDPDSEKPRVPTVSFVIDSGSPYIAVASKYLKGDTVETLDQKLNAPKGKHICLTSGMSDSQKGMHDINQDKLLKKELSRAIALSALVGDHDVNPGNMIAINGNDRSFRLGRIDYGHAFKDLMRSPLFGGQQVHSNNIIDFFNRETVDGIDSKSKLWRDYPGLVPSQEMVEALEEIVDLHDPEKITKAIANVKKEIQQIFNDNPHIDQEQVIRSFQRIAVHVSGQEIDSGLEDEARLNEIFSRIETYVNDNVAQMSKAAEIMRFQVAMNGAIQENNWVDLRALRAQYNQIQGAEPVGSFPWIKDHPDEPAFRGGFDDYIERQKRHLLIKEIDNFLNQDSACTVYEQERCKDLKNTLSNPKYDKSLLQTKLNQIDASSIPKSSKFSALLSKIVNFFSQSKAAVKTSGTESRQVSNQTQAAEPTIHNHFSAFKKRLSSVINDVQAQGDQKSNVSTADVASVPDMSAPKL